MYSGSLFSPAIRVAMFICVSYSDIWPEFVFLEHVPEQCLRLELRQGKAVGDVLEASMELIY